MNLVARTAKGATHVHGPGHDGEGLDLVQGIGALGADQDDAQVLAAGGDLRALAGDAVAPETASAPEAEIERRMKEEKDLEPHLKATAQPDGHAAPVGGAGEVAVALDPPESLPRGLRPGLLLLEGTRRRRSGIKRGIGNVGVKKSVTVTTVSTPAARKRGAETRNAIRRGS